MRDILVTLMVFGALPFILRNAYFGVLVWSWLSYMNPHKLTWGFAYTMPFAQIVAIVLFISLLFDNGKKSLPPNNLVVVWGVFIVWMCISTIDAFYRDLAVEALINVVKIQAVTLVTLMLMRDLQRINMLIWVIVGSIGFFSIKGGAFTILTGGAFHVYGPEGSYIEENNTLAVAVLMIIPMMIYVYKFPPKPWVKICMPYAIFLSLASVIGSQSRGALLSIAAVAGFFWLKSSNKMTTALLFILLAVVGVSFMPDSWYDRMGTIVDYQKDSSATERLKAWEYSINSANDNFTGLGFKSWSMENYAKYAPGARKAFVAHSVYFQVLADHGWPGLMIYLLILFLIWRQLGEVIRVTQDEPDYAAHHLLARMLQVSMVAYMSGGAFLSLAYFDLAWHIMTITIVLTQLTTGVSGAQRSGKTARRSRPRAMGAGRGGRLPDKS